MPFVVSACRFVPQGVEPDHAGLVANGMAFVVCADGVPFMGYLLEAAGRELVMTAAAGAPRSGFDLVHALSVMTEVHAKDFDSIRFHTIRPGFVRRALKYGYQIVKKVDGVFIMRKQTNGTQQK